MQSLSRDSRVILAMLVGLVILAHPIVGNGPGADMQYTYEVTPIDLSNDEAVETMYHHPAILYGTDQQRDVTHQAVNSTVVRDAETIDPTLRVLLDVQFLADDFDDQYYRVDARQTAGEFRLDATPVSTRTVATELAVPRRDASESVRTVLNGDVTLSKRVPATLVRDGNRVVLVRLTTTEQVPDPLAVPKLLSYALGSALLIWVLVTSRNKEP